MSERTDTPRYYKGSSDGRRPLERDPLAKAKGAYDLVVIGSGLAGLTAANILARAGHSVCVLEQHYNFGGLATWFKRPGQRRDGRRGRGHLFDISLHGFPVGMKKTCRKYWTREIEAAIVRLDGIRYSNPQFTLDTEFTRADFTDQLVEHFHLERALVERFYATLAAMDFFAPPDATIGELFEDFFPGRGDVHRFLLEPISYANGSSLDDPAIAYGIVFTNFMSQGIFTFRGGTDWLVKAMRAELVKNGAELYGDVRVSRILVEDHPVRGRRATGVLAGGFDREPREISARAVVSNANVKSTAERLVGPKWLDAAFLDAVRAVRLNTASCQVYMGLGEEAELPWITDLLFDSSEETFSSEALRELDTKSRTFSFYYPSVRPGAPPRSAVVASLNARHGDWANLDQENYDAQKQRLAGRTLEALERHWSGAREAIEHVEVATPRTFEFYTGHPEGTSFGTKFEGLAVSSGLSEQIAGLYHAGSVGIIMSGWLGAANYGAIVANRADAFLRTLDEALAKSTP